MAPSAAVVVLLALLYARLQHGWHLEESREAQMVRLGSKVVASDLLKRGRLWRDVTGGGERPRHNSLTNRPHWFLDSLLLLAGDIELNPGPFDTEVSQSDLSQVLEVLVAIAGKWELFLTELGVPQYELDQIRAERGHLPDSFKLCLLDGLNRWMKYSDRPTYGDIISALQSKIITDKPLAARVEEFAQRKSAARAHDSVESEARQAQVDTQWSTCSQESYGSDTSLSGMQNSLQPKEVIGGKSQEGSASNTSSKEQKGKGHPVDVTSQKEVLPRAKKDMSTTKTAKQTPQLLPPEKPPHNERARVPGLLRLLVTEGMFRKKVWKEYKFQLEDSVLKYFRRGGAFGGKVAISDVVKVTPAQGDDETFEIVFAGHGSPWLLRAFTKDDRTSWMEAILPGSSGEEPVPKPIPAIRMDEPVYQPYQETAGLYQPLIPQGQIPCDSHDHVYEQINPATIRPSPSASSLAPPLQEDQPSSNRNSAVFDNLFKVFSKEQIEALKRMFENRENRPHASRELRFKAAMEKGRVKARISTVFLHGPAGSGKTCSGCFLVGEDPPSERKSTAVARPIRIFRFDISSDEWKKLTPEQRLDVLVQTVQPQQSIQQEDIQTQPNVDPSLLLSMDVNDTSTSAKMNTADDLAKLIAKYSSSSPIKLDMMHIIDTGGQPQCHELLRYFVKRQTSLYIFVFKLSEKFSVKPLTAYYDASSECVSGEHRAKQTTEKILQQCVRTMKSQIRDRKFQILFLGTHKDQESDCNEETRKAKNEKLTKMTLPELKYNIRYYIPDYPAQLIFPVDVSPLTEEEKKAWGCMKIHDHEKVREHEKIYFASIRKLITEECPFEDVDVPLQYYGLEILLEEMSRTEERKVLKWSECLAAAKQLHFNDIDFKDAISYLDKHCLIFHFRNNKTTPMIDIVFTDVQVLLDKITELVQASCDKRLMSANPSDRSCSGQWKEFLDDAKVTESFLSQEMFKNHYKSGYFTPKDLVELFRDLSVFADLNKDKGEYFVPALLETVDDLQPYRVSPSAAALSPLVLVFPNGGPQLGIFCYLIAYLLSSENSSPSAWKLKMKDDGITPECLKRNCVLFVIPKMSGSVSLVDSFHHLEVHVEGVPQFRARKCARTVLQALLHGLTKANERLGYSDVPPELGLACPCKEGEFHHATMVIDDDDNDDSCWICSKNRSKCEQLLPNQSVWPKESHTVVASAVVHTLECTGSPPSENKVDPQQVAELSALLGPVAAYWGLFLWQLGVQKHKQDEIALNNANKPHFAQVCLQDGLHHWVNSTDRPTYQRIAEVLRGDTVTNKILADEVEKFAATQRNLH